MRRSRSCLREIKSRAESTVPDAACAAPRSRRGECGRDDAGERERALRCACRPTRAGAPGSRATRAAGAPPISRRRSTSSAGSTNDVGMFMKRSRSFGSLIASKLTSIVCKRQLRERDARFGLRLRLARKARPQNQDLAPPAIDLLPVLHDLDGFERVAVDRHAGGLQQLGNGAGRVLLAVPVGLGRRTRIHHDEHDPAGWRRSRPRRGTACSRPSASSASSTLRMPMLSATPPSTRWMYGRSLLFWNSCISR